MPRGTMNWEFSTYIDSRGTRHKDPYMVLVLAPINMGKTAPTWDDVLMFVEQMLRVEDWNDTNLRRSPQMPDKLRRVKNMLMEFDIPLVQPTTPTKVKVVDFY